MAFGLSDGIRFHSSVLLSPIFVFIKAAETDACRGKFQ